MNVALMNLRITFQKNTVVTDAIGNRKNAWEDYFSCYATISSESGAETETAGQTIPQAEHLPCGTARRPLPLLLTDIASAVGMTFITSATSTIRTISGNR